jgi:dihydrofolate reductase
VLMTLNGVVASVVESPEKWQLHDFDDELSASIDAAAAQSHATLLGRRTYQEFATFWPTQDSDEPMAGYAPATR